MTGTGSSELAVVVMLKAQFQPGNLFPLNFGLQSSHKYITRLAQIYRLLRIASG
jgi:hypothetical protein